ncbi:ComF family protein [Moraxella marmotae]|uniref:ComF family protein n=1 Tax=Moraxella marmotae TaxID=3344520 RepID=UPI0035F23747
MSKATPSQRDHFAHVPKAAATVPKWVHYQPAIWLHRLHRHCVICQQADATAQKSQQGMICQHCHEQIITPVPPVKIALTATHLTQPANSSNDSGRTARHLRIYPISYYQYPVNFLIKNFKDSEQIQSLLALYALIGTLPKPEGCHAGNTVILPVPTTMSRIRHRGFNPVLILARYLAWHWQLPMCQAVARHDGTRHQRGLSRHERLDNTQMDFYLCQQIEQRQVIIFDDVVTTGATLSAVAKLVLSHYPSVRLLGVCVAHGTQDLSLTRADNP